MPDYVKPHFVIPANMNGPVFAQDGLINAVARIGVPGDKSSYGRYAINPLTTWDLDAAYRTTWFRKINDIPPFDEVRAWRTWTGADAAEITLLDNEEKRLGLQAKIAEARILARKDGGSVLLMSFGDDAAQPINIDTVGKGRLKFVTVLNRNEIQPGPKVTDPGSEFFGGPEFYTLRNGSRTQVHASRVIRFIGNPIRDLTSGMYDGWGESIWMEIRERVKQSDQIAAAIASLVDEAKVDVMKIKGLMSGLATDQYENLLVKRWGAMSTFKSNTNALLLDSEDEFEQKTQTFGGLSDLQTQAMTLLAGAADIPATRLFGRSPQGMNATGDSDMRNYYDRITAGQTMYLQPALTPLDKAVTLSLFGPRSDAPFYTWNPLYTMSEKEAMDVEKVAADTLKIYSDMGVIPEPALTAIVKDGLIERGQMPGAEQAYTDAEAANELPPLLEEPSEADLAEEAARTAIATHTANNPAPAPNGKLRLVASRDARFATDAAPRSLYVRRDVVNRADIVKWATAQGFTDIVPDLHVTIVYSNAPVDWFKMGSAWSAKLEIPAGGPRLVEQLGPKAKVLLFASEELGWRNRAMLEAGASTDYPEYTPHVTITYGDMPANVKPYTGKIVLGPEIFEEVKSAAELEEIQS